MKSAEAAGMNPLYFIGWSFYRCLFAVYFRWRVYNPGRRSPNRPGHPRRQSRQFLDPLLVGSGLRARTSIILRVNLSSAIRSSGLDSHARVNAVPVDRDGGGAAGQLRAILDRLHAGGAIILFPEGTRTPDWRTPAEAARSGIGLTVIKSAAPVVRWHPRLPGTYAFRPGKKVRIPRPVPGGREIRAALAILKISAPEARTCSKARLKEIYREIAEEIMAAIARLEPCEDKASFP